MSFKRRISILLHNVIHRKLLQRQPYLFLASGIPLASVTATNTRERTTTRIEICVLFISPATKKIAGLKNKNKNIANYIDHENCAWPEVMTLHLSVKTFLYCTEYVFMCLSFCVCLFKKVNFVQSFSKKLSKRYYALVR